MINIKSWEKLRKYINFQRLEDDEFKKKQRQFKRKFKKSKDYWVTLE